MSAQANQRTLGDLRAELRARLGFAGQGAAGGTQQTILDSFLRSAQTLLYWNYDWPEIRFTADKTLGTNQEFIDYPDGMEPRRIISVRALVSNMWDGPLIEGIPFNADPFPSEVGPPARMEKFEQLRIWPLADQSYTLRFDGYRSLGSFTETGDYTTIDAGLVFLQALADAKAHYRQPDAANYQNQLMALLKPLRAAAHGNKRYIPHPDREWVPPPMPRIVGIDV